MSRRSVGMGHHGFLGRVEGRGARSAPFASLIDVYRKRRATAPSTPRGERTGRGTPCRPSRWHRARGRRWTTGYNSPMNSARRQGLVLGGGGDVLVDRQVREEVHDLRLAHLQRVRFVVEEDEPLDPEDVGVLGPDAVMQAPGRLADLIEEPGHVGDRPREDPDNLRQPLATHIPGREDRSPSGIIRTIGRVTIRPFSGRELVSRNRLRGGLCSERRSDARPSLRRHGRVSAPPTRSGRSSRRARPSRRLTRTQGLSTRSAVAANGELSGLP